MKYILLLALALSCRPDASAQSPLLQKELEFASVRAGASSEGLHFIPNTSSVGGIGDNSAEAVHKSTRSFAAGRALSAGYPVSTISDAQRRRQAEPRGRIAKILDGEWYVSWGYNTETWAPVDIRVSQPALGNEFTVHDVKGHDEPGWDKDLLKKGITIPQYQFVVGRFVDKKKTVAVELNFDHTKYSSTDHQTARVTGVIGGKAVDERMILNPKTFRYHLHNGANHVMVNVVKRLPLIGDPSRRLSVSGIAKAGVGIMLPHADNMVFGNELDLGEKEPGNWLGRDRGWWQLDGVTAGLEAGVRVAVRPFYLEFTDKVAYSRMDGVPVYAGTAKHDLWMNQLSLSLGVVVNGGKIKGRSAARGRE